MNLHAAIRRADRAITLIAIEIGLLIVGFPLLVGVASWLRAA